MADVESGRVSKTPLRCDNCDKLLNKSNTITCQSCKKACHKNNICENLSEETFECSQCLKDNVNLNSSLLSNSSASVENTLNNTTRVKPQGDMVNENRYLKHENELLKKLVREMEENNSLLKFKIHVLENDSKTVKSTKATNVKHPVCKPKLQNPSVRHISQNVSVPRSEMETTVQNTSSKTYPNTTKKEEEQKELVAIAVHHKNTENTHTEYNNRTDGTWQTVERKKRPSTVIRGTAEKVETSTLAAADRLAWLYVGRCRSETTEQDITEYLRQKMPSHRFFVNEIKKHESNQNINKSFRVGVEFLLLTELMKPEFWPKNIVIRKYQFFRKSNK